MKLLITTTLITFIFFGTSFAQYKGKATKPLKVKPNGTVIIETFEDDPVGGLPQEWWNRNVTLKPSENPKEEVKYQYFIVKKTVINSLNIPVPTRII